MCAIIGMVYSSLGDKIQYGNNFKIGFDQLNHRGPDAKNITLHEGVGNRKSILFGHHRLAIVDLSGDGVQPMSDSRGRTIIFNGEIFNWKELKNELRNYSYCFKTNTDTEVILAAYDKWGDNCVTKFNGFWAFAIIDESAANNHRVLISRDRNGIKPVYYYNSKNVFCFGSEIKAIQSAVAQQVTINVDRLVSQLLFGVKDCNDLSGTTIYRNIYELLPAHNLVIENQLDEVKIKRYWFPEKIQVRNLSEGQALEEFSHLIEDSTRMRLKSDVETSLSLSGGLDSSAIAIAIKSMGLSQISAFTSRFPDNQDIDESETAQKTASSCNLVHRTVDADISCIQQDESIVSKTTETLYRNLSQVVNYSILKNIKTHKISVVLNGQGSDELFLGYDNYYVTHVKNNLKSLRTKLVELRNWKRQFRHKDLEKILFYFYITNQSLGSFIRISRGRRFIKEHLIKSAISNLRESDVDNLNPSTLSESCGSQLLTLLRFDDRIAGSLGMESRPVFLDHRIVEFAISLETSHKIKNGWSKYIVRKYIDSKGFPEIAWSNKKLGMPSPQKKWIKTILHARQKRIQSSMAVAKICRDDLNINTLSVNEQFKVVALESTSQENGWAKYHESEK